MAGVPSRDADVDTDPGSEQEGRAGDGSAPTRRASPYKGLTPYAADDADYFFGRESEREIIAANLLAARLTVLYGPSGVGKTSLLHAGVSRDLREEAERNRAARGVPEFVPVIFSAWREDDVIAGVLGAIRDAAGEPTASALDLDGSLADGLGAAGAAVGGEVLLILDQFEEYFLYHPRDEGDRGFDAQLARAVTRTDVPANFLISIREDALAGLDRFKGRIPHLFDNYLRVRHLDREAARAAIERPIRRFNADHAGPDIAIEPELVEQVLDEVKAGQPVLEGEGRGGIDGKGGELSGEGEIETPYLQLVMTRLWDEEVKDGSHVLRRATLARLGGAIQIVRSHLDTSLAELTDAERDLAASSFRFLVTPSGTKIALAASDLADYAGVDRRRLIDVLEHLSQSSVRILRPVADHTGRGEAQYEIFHDVLAAPILDWRRRYVAAARQIEADRHRRAAEQAVHEERRRSRTFRAVAVASAVCAVAAGAAAIWAIRAKQESRSQEAAALATSQLAVDPAESVRNAREALDARATPAAEVALRAALEESRVRVGLVGHSDSVEAATYRRDGTTLATASTDGTARLWSATTGRQLGPALRGHRKAVAVVQFDEDGGRLMTAGLDGTVRIWDTKTYRRLALLRSGAPALYASMAALSSDGSYVVTAGRRNDAVVWDVATQKRRHTLSGHTDAVTAVAISGDDAVIATGSFDTHVRLWDPSTGAQFGPKFTHPESTFVTSLEVSHDATSVVLGTAERAYVFYGTKPGKALGGGYRFGLTAAHISPDGRTIVTVGDKTAQLWESSTGRRIRTLPAAGYLNEARFSPNGRLVVGAGQEGTARVWSRGGEVLADLRGHRDGIWDAVFSPDGRRILTAGNDKTARIWSVPDEKLLEFRGGEGSGTGFARDGRHVLTATRNGLLRLWNASAQLVRTLPGRTPNLGALTVSSDGDTIITGAEHGTAGRGVVATYDGLRRGKRFTQPGPVYTLDFSRDEDRVFIGGVRADDGSTFASIRDLRGRGNELKLKVRTNLITSADFSPADDRLAASGSDKRVRIFRTSDGKLLSTIGASATTGHAGIIFSVRWSESGRSIVTAGNDGTVRVWDADDGRLVRMLHGFRGPATGAVFANHDRWIVAAGYDGSTRVWNRATGRPLAVMHRHQRAISALAFRADGVILTADDRAVKLYGCQTCVSLPRLHRIADARQRPVRRLYGG